MQKADTRSTIAVLKWLFSQHGPLEILVSDNGSQFTSETFQDFCSSCCITCVRPPPYHPQSNGQVGCFVNFKCALLKAKGEGTTTKGILNTFLLLYPTTPNATVKNLMSPTESLMGQKLWTTLDALQTQKWKQRQDASQNKAKPFLVGTPVLARN